MLTIDEIIKRMPGRGRILKKGESYEIPINPAKLAAEEWKLYNTGQPSKELKLKWGKINLNYLSTMK